jgi:hypothetical protein
MTDTTFTGTFTGTISAPMPAPVPVPTPTPVPTPVPVPTPGPAPSEPSWPSFPGGATFVGSTSDARVSVWYDASLGAPGLANAQALLADAPRIVTANDGIFGKPSGHTDVVVFALGGATDGTGGADHLACDYVSGAQIEVCASFGSNARVSALYEAELSECSMGGNLCGESTGEALSRRAALTVAGDVLEDFASAPTWQQDGEADWVNKTENTDQDYDSIGCGMAFLSYLGSLGHTLPQIAQEMVKLGDGGTLAQLYAALGNTGNAFTTFQAAVKKLGTITNDDPFGSLAVKKAAVCTARSHRMHSRGK